MRKLFPLLALSALLATVPGFSDEPEETPSAPQFNSFAGRVTGERVRLRLNPSLEGHVVRETGNGELFAIAGEKNDFYAVVPGHGQKGYVFRTFVFEGVVEGNRVNVRLYPNIEAPVVAQLNAGDEIDSVVCEENKKWLEIDLPDSARFFVAKDYVENVGPVEIIAQAEARESEAYHLLSSAYLYARSEIQKPFEEIDLPNVSRNFEFLVDEFQDLSPVASKAKEIHELVQDAYIQKKIAFLESKADRTSKEDQMALAAYFSQLEGFAGELGVAPSPTEAPKTETVLASTDEAPQGLTDKMLVWKPLEESLYQVWAATNGDRPLDEFYQDEIQSAKRITGILESYNRPVKNRPGDFILRSDEDDLPVAFLYSTKVNLQDKVGKRVVVMASPRPNNHFAFPAYFVLSVD